MKSFKITLIVVALLAILTSCDHKVSMNTVVHEDGSLDKTIVIEGDSANISSNFIGVGSAKGWVVTAIEKEKVKKEDQGKFMLTFTKHFNSAEEANQDLGAPNDTLFRVTSHFDKKFRWFYTYIQYSDTYHAINRLQESTADYFTTEDYAFIDRLPAEGSSISKADSLYLDRLNDKIFDVYGTHALFEEYFQRLENLLKSENQHAWVDTLRNHKGKLFESMQNEKDIEDFSDLLVKAGIPKLPVSDQEIVKFQQEMETLTNFMSNASSGKYVHSITMPYDVVNSNADSVAGNTLYWKPSSTKFLVKDYKMTGESRTPNIWAIAISGGFILLTIAFILYKRRPEVN
jgi:hypothetical protein